MYIHRHKGDKMAYGKIIKINRPFCPLNYLYIHIHIVLNKYL